MTQCTAPRVRPRDTHSASIATARIHVNDSTIAAHSSESAACSCVDPHAGLRLRTRKN